MQESVRKWVLHVQLMMLTDPGCQLQVKAAVSFFGKHKHVIFLFTMAC